MDKYKEHQLSTLRDIHGQLHRRYAKYIGTHASTMSHEQWADAAVQIIEKALGTDGTELLWAYDLLANEELAKSHPDKTFYKKHSLFKMLTADECAEMHFYTELSLLFYDMRFAHTMKMPSLLKHLGSKLDIDNDTLCDFLFEPEHPLFSLYLLRCMAKNMLEENVGTNGVIQDRLSEEILINDIRHRSGKDKREAVESLANLLAQMHNHEKIGRMIGLRGWKLGTYDALMGWFYEPFNPRVVKMAKELNEYITEVKEGSMSLMPSGPEEFRKMLYRHLMQLAEKHGVTIYEEELTMNYIFSNNTHLYEISFYDEES